MGFVQRRLVKGVMWVVSFPKLALAVCAVVLVAAVVLAATGLGLSTNQDDLMTPKLKFFKDYKDFTREFPENEAFYVIVEPRDYAHLPAGKRWMELADKIGESLQGMKEYVRRVDWKLDVGKFGTQGLLFAPWEEVSKIRGLGGAVVLADMMKPSDDPMMNGYQMIPDESKRGMPAYETDKILVISVYAKRDYSSLKDVTEPLKKMREAVAAAAKGYDEFVPPVITGRPALEADEMATSDRDTTIAEVCGLGLVFVVLLIFLRNLWLVVVAELCLGVGIGWTFGWATLAVGRLNLLSLVFVIALIGIGMDYLIQILTRYRFEKRRYTRPQAVWARVFRYVSPPISTACAGAAGAFLVSELTSFQGAAELGLIAGGGLLLTLLAGYTVLPALLTVVPASVGKVHESRRYRDKEPLPGAGGWRWAPVVLWVVVAAGGLWLSLPAEFDGNLLRLQAEGLPSVQAVRRLQTWSAVVMSKDLGALRQVRAALLGRKADAGRGGRRGGGARRPPPRGGGMR
jgi:predicted RND superfamily exporter protein